MTRFERATIIISLLALVMSLAAAVLSPWLTYRYFDTAAKRRGTLIVVRSDVVESAPGKRPSKVSATIEVQNIGHDPANNAKIVAVKTSAEGAEPEVTVGDRVTQRTGAQGRISEYAFSQPVAPNESVTITARGYLDHLYLRTDHETILLYEPNLFGSFSANQ